MTRCNPRWLFIALVLTLTGVPLLSSAQAIPTPPKMTDPHLTPAQQARMSARNMKFTKDRAALIANTTLTPTQKETQLQALVKAANADALAILNPTQQAIVKKNREAVMQYQQQAKQRALAFQQAHKAEYDAGTAVTERLNQSLTPTQKTQIATFQSNARVQFGQLLADKAMTPKTKQVKLMAIQQQTESKILAVLSPSQQADFKQIEQMQRKLQAEAKVSGKQ